MTVLEMSRVDRLEQNFDLAALFPNLSGPFTAADLALVPPRTSPNGSTVWTACGVTAGVATPLFAGPDADSSGAFVVTGSADVWLRVTVGAETDAAKAARITLLGSGTVVAPGPVPPVLSIQGRTGAVTLSAADVGADASGAASTAQAAAISAAATDATSKANAAQAYAIQRGNHTGTQVASTISDLGAAVAADPAVRAAYVRFAKELVADDATDNRAALQAIADQGGIIILPKTTSRYAVAGTITLSVPGTQIWAHGAPMRQATRGETIFRVDASDCLIDGLNATGATGTVDISGLNTSWQSTIIADKWCAVNIGGNAHRLRVPWIRGSGFSSVIRTSGWDYTTDTQAAGPVQDVEIGTVLCDKVEFGFLAHGNTQRLRVASVRGAYGNVSNSPRSGHLVYLSATLGGHTQTRIGDCSATSGATGSAYQFKGVNSGQIGYLQATSCPGALVVMDCQHLEVTQVISLADSYSGAAGSITIDQTATTDDIRLRAIRVYLTGDSRGVQVLNGTRVRLDDIYIEVSHTTTGGGTTFDVELRGTGARVGNVEVNNLGTLSWIAVGTFSGSGHRVDGLRATNVQGGAQARSTNLVVEYDRDLITLHPTDGRWVMTAENVSAPGCKFNSKQTTALRSQFGLLAVDSFECGFGTGKALAVSTDGHLWSKPKGTWLLDGTTMRVYESSGTSDAPALLDVAQKDVSIECGVRFQSANGLIARAVDGTNYLALFLHSSGLLRLRKFVAGVATTLLDQSFAVVAGRRYRMRMVVIGSQILGYVDDVLILNYTLTAGDDVSYGTATQHGIYSSGASTAARYDSFRIAAA